MSSLSKEKEIAFLLPVYNGELSLDKTLYTILNQDYKNFSIYIIDNGSTDNTSTILKRYAMIDERIKLYKLEKADLSKALLFALNIIEEEYILRIDSGDTCEVNRVSKSLEFMKNNPNCSIGYTNSYLKENKYLKFNELPSIITKRDFLLKNRISHSTLCLRRSKLKEVDLTYSGIGNIDLYFGPSQDLLLLSNAIFVLDLEVRKISGTSSTINKVIKDSISFKNKFNQRRVASRILLINNIKLIFERNNSLLRIYCVFCLLINISRLLRYKDSVYKIITIFNYLKLNLSNYLIYQKIVNL